MERWIPPAPPWRIRAGLNVGFGGFVFDILFVFFFSLVAVDYFFLVLGVVVVVCGELYVM